MESNPLLIAIPGGWVKKGADGLWHSTGFDDLKNHFGAPGSILRVEAGAVLFKKNPNSFIAALGGKGQLSNVPGARPVAEIMKRELAGLGVPEEKILEETESGTTYEQLKALMKTTERISPEEVVIVSNRYHLPRMEAMVKYAPVLKDAAKKFKIKFASAEDVLAKSDPKAWKKILKAVYDSAEIKELAAKEESGARQIRESKYRYPVKFSLRRVEPRDSDFLFNLRNDVLVRRLSRRTEIISADIHKKWFEKKMSGRESVIFVAEDGALPIAQTRFDFTGENSAEVNIAVSADFRGRGYGTKILKEATNLFLNSHPNIAAVHAFIKPENAASLKSFSKAGYVLQDKTFAKNKEYVSLILEKNNKI